MDHLGNYDVIVIGAGHAGIEAAHAAAVLGAKTAVFTLTLDFIGNMPCNPSIGGTAKGHLVREIDALGGLMGLAADATFLQSRMLNRGKGPAVHSLRVQTDRARYHIWMKHALEQTPNLFIHQAEVTGLKVEGGRVCGVCTNLGGYYGLPGRRYCNRHKPGRPDLHRGGKLRRRAGRFPRRHRPDRGPCPAGLPRCAGSKPAPPARVQPPQH